MRRRAFLGGAALAPSLAAWQRGTVRGEVYGVTEMELTGPAPSAADSPARDTELQVTFRHERSGTAHRVHGFWDGGATWRVRFCPTRPGRWRVTEVRSNRKELAGQRQGDAVEAAASRLHGFWEADAESPGRRWYRRSDGSHPYVFGNTHYSFLSEMSWDGTPNGSSIARDVRANAEHFKKLRFSAVGDLYPNPSAAPFLDAEGTPTLDGNFSHRPNPAWFQQRLDVAVRTAFEQDLIADLILAGVDATASRSALLPRQNEGDATPFLRYLAARYGAFPNAWFCVINEYDIRTPRFTPEQVKQLGRTLKGFLAYPSPVSVHRAGGPWLAELNSDPAWNDHVIIQRKLRDLGEAADAIRAAHAAGGGDKPVIDDELSYEGAGDQHSEGDTIESHLGAFLGGGYGTTGYKSGGPSRQTRERGGSQPVKTGQYFTGRFDAAEHTAADNLTWLREVIDRRVTFWRMAPAPGPFENLAPSFRAMAWEGREYVLGTDRKQEALVATLPPGRWAVTAYDVMSKTERAVAEGATGRLLFDAPDSRAVLFHFRRV